MASVDGEIAFVREQLAPHGELRVAINYGNPVLAQRGADGEPAGVSVLLARALAAELEVELDFITFDAAGEAFKAIDEAGWRLGFLARDPIRAERVRFTEPYVIIEGTYLVRRDSPFHHIGELDAEGISIAVGQGAAYDLFLSRELCHATLKRAPTSAAAIALFVEERLDAAAGVRQPLERYASEHADFRVLPGQFTTIEQCMAIPNTYAAAADYVERFLTRMKREGEVKRGLLESGQSEAQVAP